MIKAGRGVLLGLCLAGALPAGPAGAGLKLDQAAVLLHGGQPGRALEVLRGDPKDGGDPQSRDLLEGMILHRLGRDAEAVAPLKRAFERRPGDFDAALDLGQALLSGGRWDQARKAFDAARSRHPAKAEPWLGLGQIAAGEGDWSEALRCFRRAADLAPGSQPAWLGLSDACLQKGQLRQSAEARDKALQLSGGKDADLLFKQAVAWYGLGELDRAEKAMQEAGLGDKPQAFFLAGCLAHRRGRFDEAERDFLAALNAQADFPQARLDLGITYYSQERYDEALAQFDLLLQKEYDEQAAGYRQEAAAAASDHYLRQGSEALLAGDLLKAMDLLQKAETLAPESSKGPLQKLMTSVRQQQGPLADRMDADARQALKAKNLAQAVLLWQGALRLFPEHAGAKQGLASVRGDLGALARAYGKAALAAAEAGDQAQAQSLALQLSKLDAGAGKELQARLQKDRDRRTESLMTEGIGELGQGRPRAALERFDRVLQLDAGDLRAQKRRQEALSALHAQVGALLAQALEAEGQGRAPQALTLMRRAQALDPTDLEAMQGERRLARQLDMKRDDAREADDLYYKGVYAYGAGDTQGAVALWKEGARLDPENRPVKEALRRADLKLRTLAALGQP